MKDIVIPLISGLAPTLLLGIGWLVKRRSDKKIQEDAHKNWVISELREAFLMEKNDLDSRIDAWKKYQTLGGPNYTSYIDELLAKKGLKKGLKEG